jgi:hypothetical protein
VTSGFKSSEVSLPRNVHRYCVRTLTVTRTRSSGFGSSTMRRSWIVPPDPLAVLEERLAELPHRLEAAPVDLRLLVAVARLLRNLVRVVCAESGGAVSWPAVGAYVLIRRVNPTSTNSGSRSASGESASSSSG